MATTIYEHILKNGKKVQVDSAVRDVNGVRIDTNYAKKSEIPSTEGLATVEYVDQQDTTMLSSANTYTDNAISALPSPMQFKGTLGTGGTITQLPAAAATNKGFVYKVITDGTYQSIVAKVGDTFISTGEMWVLIPSGDEPSGTVTNVATGIGLTGGPITTSGTISVDFNSVQAKLISANNIKTINNQTILGEGNLEIKESDFTATEVQIEEVD